MVATIRTHSIVFSILRPAPFPAMMRTSAVNVVGAEHQDLPHLRPPPLPRPFAQAPLGGLHDKARGLSYELHGAYLRVLRGFTVVGGLAGAVVLVAFGVGLFLS